MNQDVVATLSWMLTAWVPQQHLDLAHACAELLGPDSVTAAIVDTHETSGAMERVYWRMEQLRIEKPTVDQFLDACKDAVASKKFTNLLMRIPKGAFFEPNGSGVARSLEAWKRTRAYTERLSAGWGREAQRIASQEQKAGLC